MRMSRPASLLVGLALLASVTACSSDSDSPTGAEGSPSGSSTGQPSTSQPTSGTPASTAQDSKSNADAEIDFTVSDAGLVRAPGPKGLRAAAGDKVEFSLDNTSSSPYTMRLIDAKGKTLAQDSDGPSEDIEFVQKFAKAGSYQVLLYAKGEQDAAHRQPFVVQ